MFPKASSSLNKENITIIIINIIFIDFIIILTVIIRVSYFEIEDLAPSTI